MLSGRQSNILVFRFQLEIEYFVSLANSLDEIIFAEFMNYCTQSTHASIKGLNIGGKIQTAWKRVTSKFIFINQIHKILKSCNASNSRIFL